MTPTLHHIRYYSDYIHPDALVRRKGWEFVFARALNYLRFRVESWVQYLVARGIAREEKLPLSNRRAILAKFHRDSAVEEMVYHQESPLSPTTQEADVPLLSRFKLVGNKPVVSPEEQMPEVEVSNPQAPKPITDMIEKYGQPKRQRRYALTPPYQPEAFESIELSGRSEEEIEEKRVEAHKLIELNQERIRRAGK